MIYMKPLYSFALSFIVISLCLFGIFHLIFPEYGEMMIWCTISGIALIATILGGVFLTSSKNSFDIKNTSSLWVLNFASLALFLWTLVFVFLVGDYNEPARSMDGLYIGYLIIIGLTSIVFIIACRGASVAQSHSNEIQERVVAKEELLHILVRNLSGIEELFSNPGASEVKDYKNAVNLLRRMPNSSIITANDLQAIINVLSDDIAAKDINKVSHSIFNLTKYLKSK